MKAINLAILLFVIGNICHAFEIDGNPIQTILNINKDIGMVANNFDKGSYYDRWDQDILGVPFATKAKTRVSNRIYEFEILYEHYIVISTTVVDRDKSIFNHLSVGVHLMASEITHSVVNQLSAFLDEGLLIMIEHLPEQGLTWLAYKIDL